MGILYDAIISSIKPCGQGFFYFGDLTEEEVALLKSITKRQRQKYQRYDIVPDQVLAIAYENGLLPGNAPPKGGVNVKRLVTILGMGPYRDDDNKERALWFLGQIIKERMPKCLRRK